LVSAIRVRAKSSCPRTVPITGKTDDSTGITRYTFKYANAPRWEEGKLVDIPTKGEALDASHSGQKCMQSYCVACGWKVEGGPFKPGIQDGAEGSEDCLFLSIFLKKKPEDAAQPVLFHIHHGQDIYGFKGDFGDVDGVASKDIAVVTANMRLGPFGIFAHPQIKMPNFMVSDIINGMRWVKKYGCTVGADPSRLTLEGSSSAGTMILALLTSPAAKGLFSAAWVNSPVAVGFEKGNIHTHSPQEWYEQHVQQCVSDAGCDTAQDSLACLKALPGEELVKRFINGKSQKCSLARLSKAVNKGEAELPGRPYDPYLVPNMMQATCSQQFANMHVPVVIGHAKDELDSLKFQFGDMEKSAHKLFEELSKQATSNTDSQKCLAKKLELLESHQDSIEDLSFNLPTYMYSTVNNPKSGPRYHFTITSPSSITGRTWHTTPEILVWNMSRTGSSPLYNQLTKVFVVKNSQPNLEEYVAQNFQNFIKTGKPLDANWPQTATVAPGQLGGLPSVDISSEHAGVSKINNQMVHSSSTMRALHSLICNKKVPEAQDEGLKLNECLTNPEAAISDDLTFKHESANWEDGAADFKQNVAFNPANMVKMLGESMMTDMRVGNKEKIM